MQILILSTIIDFNSICHKDHTIHSTHDQKYDSLKEHKLNLEQPCNQILDLPKYSSFAIVLTFSYSKV